MSSEVLEQAQVQVSESVAQQSGSLLEQAIQATKQTERSQAELLLKTLTEGALDGTVLWNKNVTATINDAIEAIDAMLSKQLASIMHHQNFQQLEGSWRGLKKLVHNSETGVNMRIRLFSASKKECYRDLDRAVEFDQSQLYKKIYENEFGTPGGEPYGVLLGDYEFTNHPSDIDMLRHLSSVAAASFCPFVSAASPELFGFEKWNDLAKPRDLAKIFTTAEYAKWRSFRESEDSRFIVLTLPRTLARLPYGEATRPIEEFHFEENQDNREAEYCWSNAAYSYVQCLTRAFATHGWCTAIRGAEAGGKLEDLPLHTFISDDGDVDAQCPSEVGITDRREAELSNLGFLPLSHYKNTDYAVFFGAQTTHKPKKYDRSDATDNAQISARMPYIMATSRFAHYLKILARDKIGSFMEASDVEAWLNRWIMNYANANADANEQLKAKYPLNEAKVVVNPVPGNPGAYQAVAWLRPWLQMEELTTSMRLVAKIPKDKK
jgi:type VI secretion system protein ImpC